MRLPITLCRRLFVFLLFTCASFLFIRSFIAASNEGGIQPSEFASQKSVPTVLEECVGIKCEPGTLQLFLSSESQFASPIVCFNNARLFREADLVKGLNIAVINENSQAVDSVHYVSLLDSDHDVIQFLSSIENYRIIVIASYGDVASKLSAEARHLLATFGALSLDSFSSGNSLLMVGQRGLLSSTAFIEVTPLTISKAVYFSRCFNIPMGKLSEVARTTALLHRIDENLRSKLSAPKGAKMVITYGAEVLNCGNPAPCGKDEIALSFYSGKDKDDAPRVCVNGRYIIDRDLNGAGRGLNIVVIDVKTRQVVRVGHFDTYDQEDTDLIYFLDQLALGEIVAVVSFDEAASRLSDTAKKVFYELGSSLVHDIKFRASWYFLGQKGIRNYSPFEDMVAPSGNNWANPIDLAICAPLNLNSHKSEKNRVISKQPNSARRHFCEKYDGYGDFCQENHLDIVPTVKGLSDLSQSKRPVYSLPILLAGGLTKNNIRLCLEKLLSLEGINLQNVVVSFDAAYSEVADLAALFHTRSLPIVNSSSYNELVLKSVSHLMDIYPSSPCIIVIQEDVLPSPDFLNFIDQLLADFLNDGAVSVLQLFNRNAFLQSSSLVSAVYRFENASFSKGFVLKRIAFEKFMKNKEEKCCSQVDGWRIPGVSFVPEVSRISLIESEIFYPGVSRNEGRRSTTEKDIRIKVQPNGLSEKVYDYQLRKLIRSSKKIFLQEIADCQPGSVLESPVKRLALLPEQPFAVIFPLSHGSLSVLFHCFHLGDDFSYGLYRGVIRFSIEGHPALLVPSGSALYISGS